MRVCLGIRGIPFVSWPCPLDTKDECRRTSPLGLDGLGRDRIDDAEGLVEMKRPKKSDKSDSS